MKKYIVTGIIFLFAISAKAQKAIQLGDVGQHTGDSVKVEGVIGSTKLLDDGRVLVNLGAAYPNQLLTIVVYPSYKTATIAMPSQSYVNDIAIVKGKVELYKGKPQIVVTTSDQLHIASGSLVVPKHQ